MHSSEMDTLHQLERHGLFDLRVPRYTSYPPANHFRAGEGQRHQHDWLSAVRDGEAISLYIHIPFCKRLCWFCACRTQGTRTLRPVETYLRTLLKEITEVRKLLPNVRLSRLHLGGGTPTILSCKLMRLLLDAVFAAFERDDDCEFSVEIDPTEASDPLLKTLVDYGLNRASIGVQDFSPLVQAAIGRQQSVAETRHVIDFLRDQGVPSINVDLLYGLPCQTPESFDATLEHVLALSPDRLAIYGYAHVPWMSKRQVMIDEEALPDTHVRFALAERARLAFEAAGYTAVGIDHFSRPTDSLARAQGEGRLRRNFQGYTDDTDETLIGLGASAISQFRGGYVQNAVATSAYHERIAAGGLAGHRGYEMTALDRLVARMVEDLMCSFAFRPKALAADFPQQTAEIERTRLQLIEQFGDVLNKIDGDYVLPAPAQPLARIVAHALDTFSTQGAAHAVAI